jgi:hypothetical protein
MESGVVTSRSRLIAHSQLVLFLIPALIVLGGITLAAWHGPKGMMDFHTYLVGGHDVLNGQSPYPAVEPKLLAGQEQFVYPAPAALLFAGLALLPSTFAAVLWYAAMLACAALALWLVGVCDWRVYALCAATDGIAQALHVGSITPLLMLLAAVAWRYRDRAVVCGFAIALGIGLKLLLLPLIGWLVICGRIKAAAVATLGSVVLMAVSWAALGFAGLADYNRTLNLLGEVLAWRGFSTRELFLAGGASLDHAKLAAYVVAAGLCLLALQLRWLDFDERIAFSCFLVSTLALSPVVWLNYFSLAILCLALARPRMHPAWLLPLALWAMPHAQSEGMLWPVVLWHGLLVAVLAQVAVAARPAVRLRPAMRIRSAGWRRLA